MTSILIPLDVDIMILMMAFVEDIILCGYTVRNSCCGSSVYAQTRVGRIKTVIRYVCF